MRSVALDLAVRKIAFCEVRDGKVIARRMVSSLETLDDLLGEGTSPAVVAVEACREAWYICEKLERYGHRPLMVDTTRVRQLGIGHGRKTDRIDAEVLARAVESGGIPVAHRLSPDGQRLRSMLMVRRGLVETRAQMIVTVRGLVRARGVDLPACRADLFVERVKRVKLSDDLQKLVRPLLGVIERVDAELEVVGNYLEELYIAEPMVENLSTVPGVGKVVAAAFVSVIDDPKRFRSSHQVAAYLGLVPAERSSGDKRRLGAITKRGNAYLRGLLVQASWCILRTTNHDDRLRVWGHAVAKRRGKKAIAVVAIARRLAGILWAMWRDGTAYDPAPAPPPNSKPARRRQKGVRMSVAIA